MEQLKSMGRHARCNRAWMLSVATMRRTRHGMR